MAGAQLDCLAGRHSFQRQSAIVARDDQSNRVFHERQPARLYRLPSAEGLIRRRLPGHTHFWVAPRDRAEAGLTTRLYLCQKSTCTLNFAKRAVTIVVGTRH